MDNNDSKTKIADIKSDAEENTKKYTCQDLRYIFNRDKDKK